MEAQPTIESQSIPFGFTCDVQTCTTCGPEPTTATITYPVNGHPYINGGARPTLMPAKPGEISAESGGPSGGQAGSNDGSRSGQNGEENGSNSSSNSGTNGSSHSSSKGGQNGSHDGSQTGNNSVINGDSNGGSQSGQNGGQDAKSNKGNAEPEITRTDDGFELSVRPTSGTYTSEAVSSGTSDVPVAVSGAGRELGLTGLGMTS